MKNIPPSDQSVNSGLYRVEREGAAGGAAWETLKPGVQTGSDLVLGELSPPGVQATSLKLLFPSFSPYPPPHRAYRTQNDEWTGTENKAERKARRAQQQCENGSLIKCFSAVHGVWKLVWIPCSSWSCEPCRDYRVVHELVPEIMLNMEYAREIGETLKMFTFTWDGSALGAQPTREGATRRRWDAQHYRETLRRQGLVYESLRVAESHRSGKIHIHELAVTPFLPQAIHAKIWKRHSGAVIMDVEAVYMRCPQCWPGRGATRAEKKKHIVVPPPGKGECPSCGYRPDWADRTSWLRVARSVAEETSKYLTKELPAGQVVKKLTRTQGWKRVEDEVVAVPVCECCGEEHVWKFVSSGRASSEYSGEAFYPRSGEPCGCMKNVAWSKSFLEDHTEVDFRVQLHQEIRAPVEEQELPPMTLQPREPVVITPYVLMVQAEEMAKRVTFEEP